MISQEPLPLEALNGGRCGYCRGDADTFADGELCKLRCDTIDELPDGVYNWVVHEQCAPAAIHEIARFQLGARPTATCALTGCYGRFMGCPKCRT